MQRSRVDLCRFGTTSLVNGSSSSSCSIDAGAQLGPAHRPGRVPALSSREVLSRYHPPRVASTDPVPGSVDGVDDAPASTSRRGSNLTPFRKGDPRAAAAGRKGGAVRRGQRDARIRTVRGAAQVLDEISATFDRERLGAHAASVAGWLMAQIAGGAIPV